MLHSGCIITVWSTNIQITRFSIFKTACLLISLKKIKNKTKKDYFVVTIRNSTEALRVFEHFQLFKYVHSVHTPGDCASEGMGLIRVPRPIRSNSRCLFNESIFSFIQQQLQWSPNSSKRFRVRKVKRWAQEINRVRDALKRKSKMTVEETEK